MFGAEKFIIGMLHLPALPGSPLNKLEFDAVIDWVLEDAKALTEGGVHALMMENFGDMPFYPDHVPPHTVAYMSAAAMEVKRQFKLPLGINVLRNDVESALGIAAAVAAEFVRVNVHVGARLTDQGLIEGRAYETVRYRKALGSAIKIFADVDVKHSAPLADSDLETEVEETIGRGCADAVIVSGSATGRQTSLEDLKIAKAAAGDAHVIAGSGVDASNVAAILGVADAVIVGTSLKRDGVTTNPVDAARVRAFMQAVK